MGYIGKMSNAQVTASQIGAVEDVQPRKPGRPKGSKNRDRVATIERIQKEADPLGFWIRVAKGRAVQVQAGRPGHPKVMHQPTSEQVLVAQEKLLARVMPALKAVEMSGEGGGALVVQVVRFGQGDSDADPSR